MDVHTLAQLRARVESEGVRLSFFLTTPVFESLHGDCRALTIRIQRKRLPEFSWGRDYAEYFDGLTPAVADTLFEGAIESINNRKFEYLDTDVSVGDTYAYWVSCPLGRLPTGPASVRVRDLRIWWSQRDIESRLTFLADTYPSLVSVRKYGTTVHGRSILGLSAGNRDTCLALVGTIHAGESGPELMIPAIERMLAEHPDLLDRAGIAILPNVNIDERERLIGGCPWYLRTNARGVDINRNFNANWTHVDHSYGLVSSDTDAMTYRGPRPKSEPETRAVIRFLHATQPKAVLSYHALASITGANFLLARAAEADSSYVQTCKSLVEPFVGAFYQDERWRAGIAFGASAGSLPEYAYRKLGIPGFDLEWDGNPDARDSHTDQTSLSMLQTYQERHFRGLMSMLRACAKNHAEHR